MAMMIIIGNPPLAYQFYKILKKLWNGGSKSESIKPSAFKVKQEISLGTQNKQSNTYQFKFKKEMCKLASQFQGFGQHDSFEFLTFILS
jgi:ubiquitin C-terminal hydrolase